jgi:hypothetical protein
MPINLFTNLALSATSRTLVEGSIDSRLSKHQGVSVMTATNPFEGMLLLSSNVFILSSPGADLPGIPEY